MNIVATHGRALPALPYTPTTVQVVALGAAPDAPPAAVGVLVAFPDDRRVIAWGPVPYSPDNVQAALAASVAVWDRARAGATFPAAPTLAAVTLPTTPNPEEP